MMHQTGRTLDSHPTVLEHFDCFPHTGEPFAGDNQVDLPSVPGVGPSILVPSCSHNAKEAQWKRNTLVVFIGNMSMDWGRFIFNQRFTLSLIFCHWHVSFKNDKLENHEMKKGWGLTLAMCLLWLILIQIVWYHLYPLRIHLGNSQTETAHWCLMQNSLRHATPLRSRNLPADETMICGSWRKGLQELI